MVNARLNNDWIDPSLPLCELHRHLDGNVRLATILDLARQHRIDLPASDVTGLAPFVHIDDSEPGLMAFLARFEYLVAVLADLDACRRVARENVEDAAAEGIDHVELRFSPAFMAERHGLDPEAVVEAVAEGVAEGAAATGTSVGLIGIMSRTYGVEACARELDALLARREHLVAVDLAGDEAGYPPALFRAHFDRVREAGLGVTIHAGEAAGADSVRSAIDDLGAQRIGHGFRSIEDDELIDELVERGIGLECCPTSNLHIQAVARYADHPIRRLAGRGVHFCLNTDDPGISAITLGHEYAVAAPAIGLSREQVWRSQADALAMAFLAPEQRRALASRCGHI
ncbi:adenosine deaminase [Marinihelvus fidelis]|uniref:adenosine deaminase n=1 Tax=Marinihelvus fidelis TaxID=2613842 RepID=A0A5N0TFR5_9GAMM|nr:adenosine deaminase [Marinihelvus fidelis]KAA9133324.1 adenosine deaminase [Marinihelvus fidelis]